jgi:ribosomal protein S18 acetylase RimI-like enzyme
MLQKILIEPIDSSTFSPFVDYLNEQLSDNGRSAEIYFQPLPREESKFSAERACAFRNALDVSVGEAGWRRLWGAFTPQRKLVGHIDLRAYPERFATHRCLLGMGVHREFRKLGLGLQLIEHAEEWGMAMEGIEWIDLQVLSVNEPAIRLYNRAGFLKTGEVPEMFKIDGRSLSFTSMSKRIASGATSITSLRAAGQCTE